MTLKYKDEKNIYFLVLFVSLTILFQLTFTFIYSNFKNKNLKFS